MASQVRVGTAGWSLPRLVASSFPGDGSQLARYARVFAGVEINTSAYRDHSADTYAGWARQTPRGFRFAVKLPQRITHENRLRASRKPLESFLTPLAGLGSRLGPLVVQLPPSLPFEKRVARTFFELLRERHAGPVGCEPRHPSWFDETANDLLISYRIARIAADPAVVLAAATPGGWPDLVYYRLHGSPRKYWSVYEDLRVDAWTRELASYSAGEAWCVFDNTAGGGAAGNALRMNSELSSARLRRRGKAAVRSDR
ncbi:MAG: DUF72 domain-containing protein [Steroidobacteraceae bacterium]